MDNFKRSIFARKAKTPYEKSLLKATYSGDFDVPKEKHIQTVIMGLQGKLEDTYPDSGLLLLMNRLKDRNWSAVLKAEIITHRSLEHLGLGYNNRISELEVPLEDFHDPSEKGTLHNKIIQNYFTVIKLIGASKRYSFLTLNIEEMSNKVNLLASEEMVIQATHMLEVLEKIVETAPEFHKSVNAISLKVTQNAAYWLLKESIRTYSIISILLDRLVDRFYKLGVDLARKAIKCYELFERNTHSLKSFFSLANVLPYKDLTPPVFVNRPNDMVAAMNKYVEEANVSRSISARQIEKNKKIKKVPDIECEDISLENLHEHSSPSNQRSSLQIPMMNFPVMYNSTMSNPVVSNPLLSSPTMAQLMQNQMLQRHYMQNAFMTNPMMQSQMMANSNERRQNFNHFMEKSLSNGTPKYNPFD